MLRGQSGYPFRPNRDRARRKGDRVIANPEDHPAQSALPVSERLGLVQETLRTLLADAADPKTVEALAEAAHELGRIRLALDAPRPDSRRAHLRVPETIGTALTVGGREVDAAIVDVSVGGVGLVTDERLPTGTILRVAIPPVGWIDAEVVAADGDRLHVRFQSDGMTAEQQRALLDLVLRHYD